MIQPARDDLVGFRQRRPARFVVSMASVYADLDTNGHVNHARYLGYLEECRLAFRREIATQIALDGLTWPIAEVSIRYLAPIFYPATLSVELAPIAVGRTSYTLGYGIYGDDACCAVASTRIVCMEVATNKPTPLPPALAHLLASRIEV